MVEFTEKGIVMLNSPDGWSRQRSANHRTTVKKIYVGPVGVKQYENNLHLGCTPLKKRVKRLISLKFQEFQE